MARENQGLQIALIVFVILTIGLGVATFMCFRQYEEAAQIAEGARQKEATANSTNRTLAEECTQLKEHIGFSATQNVEDITTQFTKDMQEYGAHFPEEARFYSPVLGYLFKSIKDKNEELEGLKTELQELKDLYEVREASKDQQIRDFQAAAEKAEKDKAAEIARATAHRTRVEKAQVTLTKTSEEKEQKLAAELDSRDQKIDEQAGDLHSLKGLVEQTRRKLDNVTNTTFEAADGKISRVSQRSATVWINLGRADALQRQVNFSVYPADTTNLKRASKKASIEVIQIIDNHLAEARIIEDEISNPILPGDKIYTPVWTAGKPKRFALAGFMDLDEDGKSDQRTVRELIELNGGTVDCWVDEAKGQLRGKVLHSTNFLVLGEAPKASASATTGGKDERAAKAYTQMMNEAGKFAVRRIGLDDLLQQMGWKNQSRVTQFGRGSNPNDFRPKAPEGGPKVSDGNVSGLFKERRPPRGKSSGRGGAY